MNRRDMERRKFPRASFPCKIIVEAPLRLMTSYTQNIGEGGVRVILEEKLEVYEPVSLELFFSRENSVKCKGRIVWVVEKFNPIENTAVTFDTGVEFTNIGEGELRYIQKIVRAILSKQERSGRDDRAGDV